MAQQKRILLKISGEMLRGSAPYGIEIEGVMRVAQALELMRNDGWQVGVVVGGGNICRGLQMSQFGVERTAADQMGMLATLMNGLALKQALKSLQVPARLMTGLECPQVAERFQAEKAIHALEEGEVVIFVGGTGNPYFTTDTAAALRANEIHANLLVKATKVDGVFDRDPKKFTDAKKLPEIQYSDYLAHNLGVLDATAVALCMGSRLPIFVFNMSLLGKMSLQAILDEKKGSFIRGHDAGTRSN